MNPEDTLKQVTSVIHAALHNAIGPGDAVYRIADIVGEPLKPPPPDPDGYAVHCVLCLNGDRGRVRATTIVDGYSVCDKHGQAIVYHGPGMYFTTDDRFALRATVDNMRASKRRRAESV